MKLNFVWDILMKLSCCFWEGPNFIIIMGNISMLLGRENSSLVSGSQEMKILTPIIILLGILDSL